MILLLSVSALSAELTCSFETGQHYRSKASILETDAQGNPTLGAEPVETVAVTEVVDVSEGVANLASYMVPEPKKLKSLLKTLDEQDPVGTARVGPTCAVADRELNAADIATGVWAPPGKAVRPGDTWKQVFAGGSRGGMTIEPTEQTCTFEASTDEGDVLHCTAEVAFRGSTVMDWAIDARIRLDPKNAYVASTSMTISKTLKIGDRDSTRLETWTIETTRLP